MPFPDSLRVIYDRNPLEEVICQLRFPTILRIDAEAPAAFQERVRQEYPLLRQRSQVDLAPELPPEVAKMLNVELSFRTGLAAYDFVSADEVWTLSLTRDFLAITTRRYTRWEDFREHLRQPLDALLGVYAPTFFSRIGLRYRDVIRRSLVGLDGVPWPSLLQPHIAGELAVSNVAADIELSARDIVFRMAQGRVRVRHGLAPEKEGKEICYVVDSDFFLDERTDTDNAVNILDYFSRQSGRLFRWCITERLHEALGPRPIQNA